MSDSRACNDTTSRVEHIADLMRDLQWERGKTAKRLAEEWSVSESTIRNYSAEAHRIVVAEVDMTEAGRDVSVALRTVLADSMRDGDRKNAIKAAEVWATVSGAKAAEKHVVTGAVADEKTAAEIVRKHFRQAPDVTSTAPASADEVSGSTTDA